MKRKSVIKKAEKEEGRYYGDGIVIKYTAKLKR